MNNDERRGRALDFEGAFRIARRADLLLAPHGGELSGPRSVRECLDMLQADRIGHGVRAVEDPVLVERLAAQEVTLEVCPTSNVSLGVVDELEEVPLRRLFDAGVPVALGADDPLRFGPRPSRTHRPESSASDAELAELARMSIRASGAPEARKKEMLAGVDAWLAAPPARS